MLILKPQNLKKEEEIKESPKKKRNTSGAKEENNDEKTKAQIIKRTVGTDESFVKLKKEKKEESVDKENVDFIKPPEEGYENSYIESTDYEISPDIINPIIISS